MHHTLKSSPSESQSCFQDISADVYSSLLKALQMLDKGDTSCYPVRASAAGAIVGLLEVGLPNHHLLLHNEEHVDISILIWLLS